MKTYGNLAAAPQTKRETRTVSRRVIRKKGLPVKEKLLYLGTIVVFFLITSGVLSQQATLTELDYEIQLKEDQIVQLESEMATLEDQAKDLLKPDRIIRIAEKLGMSYDPNRIRTSEKLDQPRTTANKHP